MTDKLLFIKTLSKTRMLIEGFIS